MTSNGTIQPPEPPIALARTDAAYRNREPSAALCGLVINPAAFYREAEWAAMRGVSLSTVRRDRTTGRGPVAILYGRQAYYLGKDLLAFLEARRRRSTSDTGGA